MKVLFLGKKSDLITDFCAEFTKNKFNNCKVILADRNDSNTKDLLNWRGDIIISYLYPKYIPPEVLKNCNKLAINFHPGPPEYPGIGCTNYAIYNEEKTYGVTSHIISDKIDEGSILGVKRFSINNKETLYSLSQRTYLYLLELFLFQIEDINKGNFPVAIKGIKWIGKAKTRKDFNNFLKLLPSMNKKEIEKRIFATTWPGRDAASFDGGKKSE